MTSGLDEGPVQVLVGLFLAQVLDQAALELVGAVLDDLALLDLVLGHLEREAVHGRAALRFVVVHADPVGLDDVIDGELARDVGQVLDEVGLRDAGLVGRQQEALVDLQAQTVLGADARFDLERDADAPVVPGGLDGDAVGARFALRRRRR